MAAANYGTGLVTNIVRGIGNTITGTVGAVTGAITGTVGAVTGVITGTLGAISGAATKANDIVNSMASGKYAGNLSDALSNGLTGLATSLGNAVSGTINGIASTASGIVNGVTGAIGGIGNTVSGIASSLKGTLRTAFDTVEKSFGNMSADKPNILGSSKIDGITPDLSTPSAQYASAEAQIAASEEEVLTAKRNYRNNDSPENYAALQTAESQLSSARQAGASAATSIITNPISRAAKAVGNFFTSNNSTETASATTTANSGANALPGGVGSMVSQVKGQGGGVVEGVKTAVATTATGVATLAGNLVKNTTSLVVGSVNAVVNSASAVVKGVLNTVGAIKTAAGSIISTLQTQLSSLGKSGGQIKSAVQSAQTFNIAPITAKTGSLLGDPRIPSPSQVSQVPELDKTNDQINQELKTQVSALDKIETEKENIRVLKEKIDRNKKANNDSFWTTPTSRSLVNLKYMYIQNDGLFTQLSRTICQDNRSKTLIFIHKN
jgi:phage-related protein